MAKLLDPVFFVLAQCKRKRAVLTVIALSVITFYLVYLGLISTAFESSVLPVKRGKAPGLQSKVEVVGENEQLSKLQLERPALVNGLNKEHDVLLEVGEFKGGKDAQNWDSNNVQLTLESGEKSGKLPELGLEQERNTPLGQKETQFEGEQYVQKSDSGNAEFGEEDEKVTEQRVVSATQPRGLLQEQNKLPGLQDKRFVTQDVLVHESGQSDSVHVKESLAEKQPSVLLLSKKKPFIPKHYVQDHAALRKYLSYLNRTEDILPKQTRAVIILTNHRSGSSFFGELFNQHPDAFYFFEPLFPLSFSGDCTLNNDLKTAVVEKMARCDFPDWDAIYGALPKHLRWTNGLNIRNCIAKKICFRCNTKELIEERNCPRSSSTMERIDCKRDCGAINVRTVTNECRRKKVVVLKLIRLCDIMQLEEIMENPSLEVRVLHLIRDPRGIAASRSEILPHVSLKESLKNTCTRQAHNVDIGLKRRPDWLRGRYKLFRYEDVATFPYESAESIYEFVGLDFPDVIKNWITINTGVIKSPHASHRTRRNAYGTKRDSVAVVQKWTKTLLYATVREVQSVCTDIMATAGYVKVTSEEGMKNDSVKFCTDVANILKKVEKKGLS